MNTEGVVDEVEVWPIGAAKLKFNNVDFVSLVSDTTYGKPALVVPKTEPYVEGEARVLYINTKAVAAFTILKADD